VVVEYSGNEMGKGAFSLPRAGEATLVGTGVLSDNGPSEKDLRVVTQINRQNKFNA